MKVDDLEARLTTLSTPWCSSALIHEFLGIDLPGDPRLAGALRTWSERFRGDANVERSSGAGRLVHRHALETFLLQNGWVSWKWAAVHLGLAEDELKKVVDLLAGKGLIPQLASGVSDQVIRLREAATLYRLFPAMRMKAYSSHSSMCRSLHTAIKDDLAFEVQPLLCVTSVALEEKEVDLADAFDAITLDPVGLRYQVWLETKKPVSLRPDVCSLKFYAKHETELSAHIMKGSEPRSIDQKLRDAA
ncbi:MAG: hypothetical protein ABI335_18780 [Polyangiaceae bacterium]